MSNSNCLEGMACPECGSEGPFEIEVTVYMTVYDSGTEDVCGNVEWGDESGIICTECGKTAAVKDFSVAAK